MLANLGNEKKLGFHIWAGPETASNSVVSCISGIVDSETNDGVKNYYVLTTKEGSDAIDNTVSGKYESIVGIGNASLTSYSTEGAVGGLPTASFSVEGQNMNVVHTPYTGMYEGYSGTLAGLAPEKAFHPLNIDGYGYRTAGEVVFTVTGAAAAVPVAVGSSKTVEITNGVALNTQIALGAARSGIAATIPANKIFNHGPADGVAKTITLSTLLEKGAQQVVGTVAGAALVTGDTFTGTFNDVVSYISGSNPSIDPALGIQPTWPPTSGGTALSVPAGTGEPVAPIILSVPTTNLNTSDVNVTGAISTLRPGDITLTLRQSPFADGTASDIPGASITNAHIQSYTISFDLGRTPIQKLGSRFAFARPVDFPVTASFSFDAIVSDLTTGNIGDIIDCDTNYDARVALKSTPDCNAPTVKNQVMVYDLKKIKMDSQSFSSSIGDNKTVTFDFTCQVGGPEQTDVGIFMSGYSTEIEHK